MLEPAGALALAGMKKYITQHVYMIIQKDGKAAGNAKDAIAT